MKWSFKNIVSMLLLIGLQYLSSGQGVSPTFSVRQSINLDDYLLGGALGITSPSRNFNFYGSFDFRPYRKKLVVPLFDSLQVQVSERRFFIGLGAEYMQWVGSEPFGLFLGANGHHTWGNYGGTFEKPENGIILAPRAGFFMSWWEESLILKCGYEYLDTKSEIPKHRVTISLMMVLGNATY